jgi:CDP-4-dehydro-6-deoxyglucose reductase
MPRLVSLARAARVLGVTRAELQRQVENGALPTFEGRIDLDCLCDAYPHLRWEATAAVDRARDIKATAFGRRVAAVAVPPQEVLAGQVRKLQRDLDVERLNARRYRAVLDDLCRELVALQPTVTDEQRLLIACLKGWLRERLEGD